MERLGCLAVEQLEDGQALVGGLAVVIRPKGQQKGMEPVLDLGQRVDPRIVQEVLGDMGMVVQAGVMQWVVALWRESMFEPASLFSKLRTFEAYLCIGLARVHPPLLDQVPDDLQVAVMGREVQGRHTWSVP